MPLYDYECRSCGPFRDWQSMRASSRRAPCPACGKPAPRALAMPRLGMDGALRRAHALNEKSAHEPRVVRRRRGDPIPPHDAHRDLTQAREKRHGHAHDHAHPHAHERRGGKAERSRHPWMVRH